ncbi:N-acetyltransferase 6 [Holothuria leucospilota]|uniref:N-acetyltransferase 6 n=1 Tax=Holothuria leucospilota TaxID=206669 RepID=A0A9Q1HHZ1_HOLLE|nr:N-acetyltransferase 6 [Holothuria leucospilota]
MSFHLRPLHERRDLTDECIRVINNEWPRSKALRLHSLEKSCSTLPYSLVMTEVSQNEEKKEQVVGYCRFAKVISQKNSVLIETVVVDKERRGQGLGKKLIELAENYAKVSGYDAIYLSTYDMMKFYEHLGYQYCEPVHTFGAQMLENSAVLSGTNTPLPCDNLDETFDEMKEESPVPPSPSSSADISPTLVMFWMTKKL